MPDILRSIPLLLPEQFCEFAWNGRSCAIFAQRTAPGCETPSERHFYLRDPDGLFHEIDLLEVRRHLSHHSQLEPNPCAIALAFEREPHQHEPAHLPQLLTLCRR